MTGMNSEEVDNLVPETRTLLEHIVSSDPCALDLSISLVAAALYSYRYDTVLRPFPQMFIEEEADERSSTKHYKKLDAFLRNLGTVDNFHHTSLSDEEQEFIAWIMRRDGQSYSIKTCQKNQFHEIQELTGHTVQMPGPHYIFEVLYNEEKDQKFRELQGSHKSIYAYHGSKLENFHSILNFGLNAHMSKNALFGEGTYLTGELSVAMSFCPTGQGWCKSKLGNKLGCIAVCEIIDHPSVKCQEKHLDSSSQNRGFISGSEGGRIPEKYYVVQNNELLRVKYLLIYSHEDKVSRKHSWFQQHRFALLMFSYFILLVGVALMANKDLMKSIRRYFK